MYKFSSSEASKILGITPKTLRIWEKNGKIKSERTQGNHRRFDVSLILKSKNELDRDLNASLNLKKKAVSYTV